jgi:hypothetical protein
VSVIEQVNETFIVRIELCRSLGMDSELSATRWAEEEFGHTRLNDPRNVARLVSMVETTAITPHPVVVRVFADPAERQAAYDFLENSSIPFSSLVEASSIATAHRAASEQVILIAGDGVTLTLRDPDERRGMGLIGKRSCNARGLHIMDAVAMTESGRVLGLAGMVRWCRSLKPNPRSHKRRSLADTETRYWMELREQIRTTFQEHAPNSSRVLLHDAGADA